jgi:lycopene beta-cyclase
MTLSNRPADLILAGGGLSNALIALALRQTRPDLDIRIIEAGDRIGGNKTWSFHSTDFALQHFDFLAPLVVKSWPAQEVRFPRYTRKLAMGYNSISSERLHTVVMGELGDNIIFNARITSASATEVVLEDGRSFEARCVIDGRGLAAKQDWDLGYQKFFGLEVELGAPCGLAHPIIMDATVEQIDGYRFVYTLPFEPTRILVEDTYYSSHADLDVVALERRVKDYITAQRWRMKRIVRRESGVLPILLSGDIHKLWTQKHDVPQVGLRAFLFQPTTGYSLPDAVKIAEQIAALDEVTPETVSACVRKASFEAWESRGYFRLLNRLMFIVAEPHQRLAVMQRFYTLSEKLIRRFYACDLTIFDKARILIGKPPVAFFKAFTVIKEKK